MRSPWCTRRPLCGLGFELELTFVLEPELALALPPELPSVLAWFENSWPVRFRFTTTPTPHPQARIWLAS
ncbi:hypothetical protein GCM10022381_15330 [Leifsonia kafniensis]|uniref:Uncharacterized protein n=1 Tax=Leifsonia kafniensis TaxID=475957 RepID=A0ABP7KEJ9_9MICO